MEWCIFFKALHHKCNVFLENASGVESFFSIWISLVGMFCRENENKWCEARVIKVEFTSLPCLCIQSKAGTSRWWEYKLPLGVIVSMYHQILRTRFKKNYTNCVENTWVDILFVRLKWSGYMYERRRNFTTQCSFHSNAIWTISPLIRTFHSVDNKKKCFQLKA